MNNNGKDGFTLGLAVFDALPVLLFSASILIITMRFRPLLFVIGAVICAAAGTGKVLWKLIMALKGRDVKILAKQFRFLMPAGFLLIALSVIFAAGSLDIKALVREIASFPQMIFFCLFFLTVIYMTWLGKHMDQNDAAVNWKEQAVNTAAQLFLFIGILLCIF